MSVLIHQRRYRHPHQTSTSMISLLSIIVWLTAQIFCSFSVESTSSSSSSSIIVARGLQNLGNTCYLNSQLQCAFHIPRVRSIIEYPPKPPKKIIVEQTKELQSSTVELEEGGGPFEDKQEQSSDPLEETGNSGESRQEQSEQQSQKADNEPEIKPVEAEPATQEESKAEPDSIAVQALRRVFHDMKTSSGPVAPRILCQTLGIPVMEQQDSQEFWKLLLPALNIPALTDLYQGSFEDYIKANDGSNRERRREEAFLDLSLDVTRNSVMEGLKESFGTPELLSVKEGNGWRPEKGAEKVDALKGCLLRVQGLPPILQLHLKRFNYDWQKDRMSKINDPCSFPEELDLSEVCADIQDNEKFAACYALQSVVVHVGEFGSGHYYAYVRPDVCSDIWYRFNDHVVTKVSIDDVIADAYGGRNAIRLAEKKQIKAPPGLLRRLRNAIQKRDPFGFGGRTSNAYVVQYVRRVDIPSLYLHDNPP